MATKPTKSGPYAGVIEDAADNLYGTTWSGGANCGSGGCKGTAFKVNSAGNGTVLYNFCSLANCADGWGPQAGLIQDAAGNLYGTTPYGGANGYGTAIQERVRAGIRNARAKGRQLGRPRVVVDTLRVATLRARGDSWSQIQAQLGVSKGTAQRAFAALPKIV